MGIEASMRAGEHGCLRPEPLCQPETTLVRELALRLFANRRDDPCRTRLQRVEVGFIGGNASEIMPEPEVHVSLHLSHRLAHLGCRFALGSRWWTATDPRLNHELLHGWPNSGCAIRLVDLFHGHPLARSVGQKRRGRRLVRHQRANLLWMAGGQLEPDDGATAAGKLIGPRVHAMTLRRVACAHAADGTAR